MSSAVRLVREYEPHRGRLGSSDSVISETDLSEVRLTRVSGVLHVLGAGRLAKAVCTHGVATGKV